MVRAFSPPFLCIEPFLGLRPRLEFGHFGAIDAAPFFAGHHASDVLVLAWFILAGVARRHADVHFFLRS
jgi:hypothetical protein